MVMREKSLDYNDMNAVKKLLPGGRQSSVVC